MNYKPLTVYKELRDSYIIDGISRKKAEIYAKRDCNNSEEKENFKKNHNILNKELADAALLEGDKELFKKYNKLNSKFKRGETGVGSNIFILLFNLFLKIIFVVFDSVLFCALYNIVIVPIFKFNILTYNKCLIIIIAIGFVRYFIRLFKMLIK